MDNTSRAFSDDLLKEIRSRFIYLEEDPYDGKRIYFENAGGSLRLKSVTDALPEGCGLPDAHARASKAAHHLHEVYSDGIQAARLFLNAKEGVIFSEQTASRALFAINGAIARSLSGGRGGNVVTTSLEHPGSFDSAALGAQRSGMELRVIHPNPKDGGVDIDAAAAVIDKDTRLVCITYASNITGAFLDAKAIARLAREVSPSVYIVIDATQHAPHAPLDVQGFGEEIDGLVFAPYKVFGKRGIGVGYVSRRVAELDHDHLLDKGMGMWELGSADPFAFGTMRNVVDYVQWLGGHFTSSGDERTLVVAGMEAIHRHELALLERMVEGTQSRPGVRHIPNARVHFIPDPINDRDCIAAISFDHMETGAAVQEYAQEGIVVFDRVVSNVMSKRILESLGVDAVIRVSPLHCHTSGEVDRFLEVSAKIAAM